ncbi:cyclin2 like protein [Plasmodium vivax India VII]|uniref:Cyclin2 like protein n=1 Tax=Plasmodium vivax India VII TaxID=1077284 RepID=A0A0J9V2N2_PLAVI|nr:cyclin2 like protein [Plasmodium vivax India VII]
MEDYATEADAPRTDKRYLSYLPIVLENMMKVNKGPGKITSFHASKVPDISIKNYVERIGKYTGCSNECFVLLIIYLDRIVKVNEDISLSLLCIHRLLITATMIAAKFFDDLYYSNAFYAKVGGVSTEEINKLEGTFLHLIDYNLFVSSEEYDLYRHSISLAVERYLRRTRRGGKCVGKCVGKCAGKCAAKHGAKRAEWAAPVAKPYNLFNYTAPHRTNITFLKPGDGPHHFQAPRGGSGRR